MLSIFYGKRKSTIIQVDIVFDNNFEDVWFEDPLVKQIVEDVDNSVVISPHCIKSPVLGQISPRELSGGTKALILMLKTDWEIWATACGDNCAKWILKIAETKDLTISITHIMNFPNNEFEFIDVSTGELRKDFYHFAVNKIYNIEE